MLKVSHRLLIVLGGVIWLSIGIFLLTLGLRFILASLQAPPSFLSMQFMRLTKNHSDAMMFLVVIALFVGYLKGKYVLGKAAEKQVARLTKIEHPKLKNLYSKGYYFLILSMVGIGLAMRYLPYIELRGAIDVAIGSALIHGSLRYFRLATLRNNFQKT